MALAGCGSSGPSPQAKRLAGCRALNLAWATHYAALLPAGLPQAKIQSLAAGLDEACH